MVGGFFDIFSQRVEVLQNVKRPSRPVEMSLRVKTSKKNLQFNALNEVHENLDRSSFDVIHFLS